MFTRFRGHATMRFCRCLTSGLRGDSEPLHRDQSLSGKRNLGKSEIQNGDILRYTNRSFEVCQVMPTSWILGSADMFFDALMEMRAAASRNSFWVDGFSCLLVLISDITSFHFITFLTTPRYPGCPSSPWLKNWMHWIAVSAFGGCNLGVFLWVCSRWIFLKV